VALALGGQAVVGLIHHELQPYLQMQKRRPAPVWAAFLFRFS